ncbi:hypothetical protein MCOR02_010221 [Pyricularia oryzae]|uniref:Uncharacterized protein n=1 Tax=Pyricularia oryzae TaxID=318829 RepID=A0A4P7NQK7_PYROR|nr:hypothetical protein MCOR02_010221 [Pyricularia oryzae]KAI6255121.1 hypothetical protein MCOR19_008375 [Pyricularia oryzae]KAI6286571.1 hypothetical protein MCOR26_000962 [Pyricularia oryzae]KAI6306988.1 hypothetical protein MCOR34_007802 [Pyricularia oryzae]KAI6388680.1 hypothetical protein MCOR32_000088 [Pyricularia oryzae]
MAVEKTLRLSSPFYTLVESSIYDGTDDSAHGTASAFVIETGSYSRCYTTQPTRYTHAAEQLWTNRLPSLTHVKQVVLQWR